MIPGGSGSSVEAEDRDKMIPGGSGSSVEAEDRDKMIAVVKNSGAFHVSFHWKKVDYTHHLSRTGWNLTNVKMAFMRGLRGKREEQKAANKEKEKRRRAEEVRSIATAGISGAKGGVGKAKNQFATVGSKTQQATFGRFSMQKIKVPEETASSSSLNATEEKESAKKAALRWAHKSSFTETTPVTISEEQPQKRTNTEQEAPSLSGRLLSSSSSSFAGGAFTGIPFGGFLSTPLQRAEEQETRLPDEQESRRLLSSTSPVPDLSPAFFLSDQYLTPPQSASQRQMEYAFHQDPRQIWFRSVLEPGRTKLITHLAGIGLSLDDRTEELGYFSVTNMRFELRRYKNLGYVFGGSKPKPCPSREEVRRFGGTKRRHGDGEIRHERCIAVAVWRAFDYLAADALHRDGDLVPAEFRHLSMPPDCSGESADFLATDMASAWSRS